MTVARDLVLATAAGFLGTPYVYGGGLDVHADPVTGVDCASFTRQVFYRALGKWLAAGSRAQSVQGIAIGASLADLPKAMPGDLLFFDGRNRDGTDDPGDPAGHVALYAAVTGVDGFGQHGPLLIHAPYPGTVVRYEVLNPRYFAVSGIRQVLPRK